MPSLPKIVIRQHQQFAVKLHDVVEEALLWANFECLIAMCRGFDTLVKGMVLTSVC